MLPQVGLNASASGSASAFVASASAASFTRSSAFTPSVSSIRGRIERSVSRSLSEQRVSPRWVSQAGSAPPPPSPPSPPPEGGDDDNKKDDSSSPHRSDSSFGQSSPFGSGMRPFGNRSDDGSRDSEFDLDISGAENKNENELFQFVKSIPPPDLVQRFTQSAPPVVQKAIRETLVSMLGSLPPLAFFTSVSTMSANLVQLFHSSLVTGYMFRNATYRLELTRTLDWSGLKALPSSEDQPEIKGGVAIFKQGDGSSVEVPVDEYIGELRQTVSNLRGELQRERKGGNELLSFIATMDRANLESLTKNAGKDVVDAMKKVVDFVTTTQGIDKSKNTVVEASTQELAQLLFYLMVSGFFLREAEVRLDLKRQIGATNSALSNLLDDGSSDFTSPDTSPDPSAGPSPKSSPPGTPPPGTPPSPPKPDQ